MSATANKKKPPTTTPAPGFHNADDFKSVYINFVQTAATPLDISLFVGDANPTPSGVPEIEMKLRLVMAPMQAKVMLTMLFQVIKQYEEQYTKIVIPPNLVGDLPASESEVAEPAQHEG
jgi:hypothetical protein